VFFRNNFQDTNGTKMADPRQKSAPIVTFLLPNKNAYKFSVLDKTATNLFNFSCVTLHIAALKSFRLRHDNQHNDTQHIGPG